MRRSICIALLLLAAAATPVAATEGARARLLTRVPIHARAGALITVRWSVRVRGPSGKLVPFRSNPMFAKLIGKETSSTAFARQFRPPYSVRIRVPRGGIKNIKVGLMGYSTSGPSPEFFPITNSPLHTTR
jgi:hypothetical protein